MIQTNGTLYNQFGLVNTKVLQVTQYNLNTFGGVQEQVNLINNYLNTLDNFESKILAPASSDFNIKNTLSIPFNGSKSDISIFPSRRLLKEAYNWADVIHVHEPHIPLLFWNLPNNKKLVFTFHASYSKFVIFLLNFLYFFKKINNISVAVSESSTPNALTMKASPLIIPNMIEIDYSVNFNNLSTYLFIGRNEKRKNIKLFENLSTSLNTSYNFVAITNEKGANDHILYKLNVSYKEKIETIKNAGIYLALNSHGESFGITLLEAINNGCITVSSDIEAFKDVLEDSGVYFKNNNLDNLIETLNNLSTNNLENIFNKQKQYISRYDLRKNMQDYILLYLK